MQDRFLQKTGAAVVKVARCLLPKNIGDQMPTITQLQQLCGMSRGTVQNALTFLKKEKVIEVVSQGYKGTYIIGLNTLKLHQYAMEELLFGTMPLPYSKLYEGLATGINELLHQHDIGFNMAYMRGSKVRLELVAKRHYHFAVVSKFAAEYAILHEHKPLKLLLNLGDESYLSKHVILFSRPGKQRIDQADRVGIDLSSIDQKELTAQLTRDTQVTYTNIPGHQLIEEIRKGRIDVAIWNYDEIIDKKYEDVHYHILDNSFVDNSVSQAVFVCHVDDLATGEMIKKALAKDQLVQIQKQVRSGSRVPRY